MTRMQSVLERQKLQLLESMETDASDVICNVVVAGARVLFLGINRTCTNESRCVDGIWGAENGSDLKGSLKVTSLYKTLDGWTAKEWADLLNK